MNDSFRSRAISLPAVSGLNRPFFIREDDIVVATLSLTDGTILHLPIQKLAAAEFHSALGRFLGEVRSTHPAT